MDAGDFPAPKNPCRWSVEKKSADTRRHIVSTHLDDVIIACAVGRQIAVTYRLRANCEVPYINEGCRRRLDRQQNWRID